MFQLMYGAITRENDCRKHYVYGSHPAVKQVDKDRKKAIVTTLFLY